MGDLLGGPISPHDRIPRKWLRRWWLAPEANLHRPLGVDFRWSAVSIGGYGRERVLQGYARRDGAKARPKAHGADVAQSRPVGSGERGRGVAQFVRDRVEVRGARHIGRADARCRFEID